MGERIGKCFQFIEPLPCLSMEHKNQKQQLQERTRPVAQNSSMQLQSSVTSACNTRQTLNISKNNTHMKIRETRTTK